MAEPERFVGDLWCHQVMALLPDYVDGALPEVDLGRLVAHVTGCTQCERFGGAYGAVVARLRRETTPEGVAARLADALDEALDRES